MMIKDRPLVFLDIETTGSSPLNSRVLEIGALRLESGKIVEKFETFLHPETDVPPWITRLTGINNAMVSDAPLFSDISNELSHILRDAIFVAHNVSFDYGFINSEYLRIGKTFVVDRLCTVRLSRRLFPAQRRHNLDSLITVHDLTVQNRHRAMSDAVLLHQFYEICRQKFGIDAVDKTIDELVIVRS